MSIVYADPEINKILAIEGNNKCIDCGSDDPQWASMNNSVFVCLNCAGIHRSLGVEISYIRSLVIDNWDDSQLKKLFIGGNNRFLSNLEDYEIISKNNYISLNSDKIKKKYMYLASEYYRKLLNSELSMNEEPEKPNKSDGQRLLEENKVVIDNTRSSDIDPEKELNYEDNDNSNKNNNENEEGTKKKGLFSKVGSLFTATSNKVKNAVKATGEKFDKMEIKEKLKETGNKTVNAMKDAGKYVSDKADKVVVSFYILYIKYIKI